MSHLQLFHAVIFILFGIIVLCCNVKGVSKTRKYVNLVMGIGALLIALYDILTLSA
jgi:hypothetical protein